jgi:flagella basal body P-ring formation protein FlgA
VITAEAIHLQDVQVAGGANTLEDVIGSEVKHAVYAGRPVLSSNLVKAALIERNQIATAIFVLNGLTITTEARALERGAVGDVIRAMNLSSKSILRTEVLEDGSLKVLP